ncbi:MAG: hypothetical protein WBA22_12240 [Candidatus Methanofastidiosia archaeon]
MRVRQRGGEKLQARLIACEVVGVRNHPATECRDYGFSPMGLCVGGFQPWWIGAACIAEGYTPQKSI